MILAGTPERFELIAENEHDEARIKDILDTVAFRRGLIYWGDRESGPGGALIVNSSKGSAEPAAHDEEVRGHES